MIPNDDGRDRRTLRSQKWSTARCNVTTQERRIRGERRTHFSLHKWKEAEAHYLISLPLILARIKHGRKNGYHVCGDVFVYNGIHLTRHGWHRR